MTRHLKTAPAAFAILLSMAAIPAVVRAGPPASLDDRLTVELVAREPQLVTPTGVACDVRDNAWVIESNTHFPPKDYKRNPTDRIWVFSAPPVDGGEAVGSRDAASGGGGGLVGDAASGKALASRAGAANHADAATRPIAATEPVAGTRQVLFADGFKQAMSLMVTPAGRVYVTCRNEILLLEDKDHDLKPDALPPATRPADDDDDANGKPTDAKGKSAAGTPAADRRVLVRLETQGTYPHNGLNGAALSPDGAYLYFCLGLNAGFDYAVVGSDGSKVTGGGEGGSIWRCTPDGGNVERVATGFWNCHDLTFDAFGRLFAVDNDPDDIGPCRLLDIIDGGDYGWKYKNGRKGVHPFTSWDGHLPGTLPMVAPTGEAPSGVLAYESDNWPADYRGQLLVTSWGDHVIQRFELKGKGASFTSVPVDVVRGGEDFRPVGIAQASDGSVWVTDWVDKSYTLHGKGKLWRIRAKERARNAIKSRVPATGESATSEPRDPAPGLRADGLNGKPIDHLKDLLGHAKREIRTAAAKNIAQRGDQGAETIFVARNSEHDPRARLAAAWAFHQLPVAMRDRADAAYDRTKGSSLPDKARQEIQRLVRLEYEPLPARKFPAENVSPLLEHQNEFARAVLTNTGHEVDLATLVSETDRYQLDPFVFSALVNAVAKSDAFRTSLAQPQDAHRWNLVEAMAARRTEIAGARERLKELLARPNPAVRRFALQWVGEDRLTQFASNIADAIKGEGVSRDLLAAYLACREKLETPPVDPGKPVAERSGRQFAAEFLFDEKNDLALRKIALELIDPADPKLPSAKLVALIGPMGLEAVKALAWRDDAEAQAALRSVVADADKSADWRREAAVGLARSAAASPDTKRVLLGLLRAGPAELRTDALRSLRGALTPADAKQVLADLEAAVAKPELGDDADRQEWAEQLLLAVKPTPDALAAADRQRLSALVKARPTDTAGWQAAAKDGGDADNGRRLFSLATGARCFVCHQTNDRGGQVGPDLSGVGRAMDRAKLVESILEPSKEVAPLYVSQVIELKNGDTISGVGLPEAGAKYVSITDSTGKRIRIDADDIVSRRTEKVSVMPEGLVEILTVREFRDLVAYLASLK